MANKVIVLSGVSGSGKSTLAKRLAGNLYGKSPERFLILSADHYFTNGKEYTFDPSQLSDAHGACFFECVEALRDKKNYDYLFIDNTNTSVMEIAPYMLAAKAYEWDAELITLTCKGIGELAECATRNKHNVNLPTIVRQDTALKLRSLPRWWKNKEIEVNFVYKA